MVVPDRIADGHVPSPNWITFNLQRLPKLGPLDPSKTVVFDLLRSRAFQPRTGHLQVVEHKANKQQRGWARLG